MEKECCKEKENQKVIEEKCWDIQEGVFLTIECTICGEKWTDCI